jgi:hypothetical protein
MSVDFTSELTQLLWISARLADTIAAKAYRTTTSPGSLEDIHWMADVIASFDTVSNPIEAGIVDRVESESRELLGKFAGYRQRSRGELTPDVLNADVIDADRAQRLNDPMGAFERSGVDLTQIEAVIRAIQIKALAALRADEALEDIPMRSRQRVRS